MRKINLILAPLMAIALITSCEAKKYTITYLNLNGSISNNPDSYTSEDAFSLIEPTDHGYFFNGWHLNDINGEKITEIDKSLNRDLTLYAEWGAAREYTITYNNLNGSTTDNKVKYTVETDTFALKKPIGDNGYKFDRWLLNDAAGDVINKINKGTFGNLTIYAKWGNPNIYNINYHLPSGASKMGNPDHYAIILPKITLYDAARNGYAFAGWYKSAEYKEEERVTSIDCKNTIGDIDLYPKFDTITYSITYNDEKGAQHENPTTYTVEDEVDLLPPSEDVGYAFTGWRLNQDKINRINRGTTGNLTLVATWGQPNQYEITYNVLNKFAKAPSKTSYNIEEEVILDAPTNSSHEFKGWHIGSVEGEIVTKIEKGTFGNIDLYAEWGEVLTFNITYELWGGKMKEGEVNPTKYTVNDEVNIPYTPTQENFVFQGWFFDKHKTEPVNDGWKPNEKSGDLTIYAGWSSQKALNNYSWSEIDEISKSGEAAKYFNIGDTKDVRIHDDVFSQYIYYQPVRIIDFDHDELESSTAESKQYAGITFEFAELITTNHVVWPHIFSTFWNRPDSRGNVRTMYYQQSNLDNQVTDIFKNEMASDDVVNHIKPVFKTVADGYGYYIDRSLSKIPLKLFPLAVSEMQSDILSSPAGEGTLYKYYKTHTNLRKASNCGNICPYWLRSPNNGTQDNAYVVNEDGQFVSLRGDDVIQDRGVAPAFCV